MRVLGMAMVLALSGCDMGHLGNPAMWPGMAVGSSVENATYNARRKKVAAHVTAHQQDILDDIRAGGGSNLNTGMDLARVPTQTRPELLRTLKADINKFSPDTPQARENLVVWLMVHGR